MRRVKITSVAQVWVVVIQAAQVWLGGADVWREYR